MLSDWRVCFLTPAVPPTVDTGRCDAAIWGEVGRDFGVDFGDGLGQATGADEGLKFGVTLDLAALMIAHGRVWQGVKDPVKLLFKPFLNDAFKGLCRQVQTVPPTSTAERLSYCL